MRALVRGGIISEKLMKVIQLGDAHAGLCHFLSFGGYELLLDCGVTLQRPNASSGAPLHVRLPALHAVDVASLDVLLVSNHYSMLALPFLTERLGFQGAVYATELTLEFGRILLEELDASQVVFEYESEATNTSEVTASLTLSDIKQSCAKIQCVEYKEVVSLAYGVTVTPLSSGFSLGASLWLLETCNDRFAYVPAASGDLNRHPKEFDFAPLMDCDLLLVTDLKTDRNPLSNTERMVEQFLNSVSRVVSRDGVCVIPSAPCGVVLDLMEAIHAACFHNKQHVPMHFISPHAARVMDMAQVGPEWLCEKKIEKLYAGDSAFLLSTLVKQKILHVAAALTPSVVAACQSGGVIFAGHPSLQFGVVPEIIQMLGKDPRNAVLFIDPLVDTTSARQSFQDLEMEQIVCPIDPRLSCGDANQFIARCCPRNLIIPYEYTVPLAVEINSSGEQVVDSHFSHVLALHELITVKQKSEPLTLPMKRLEPIALDRSSKYIDGKLDPKLATKTTITEVNGKAVACVSGVLSVKRKAFVLEPPPNDPETPDQDARVIISPETKAKLPGKRKVASVSAPITTHPLEYRERSSMLLGQVDEDKLMKQIKAHDPQAQVYLSEGQNGADVAMSIPSLDARVTLWKESSKTLIETEREDSRAILTALVLAQLVVVS